MNRSIAIPLIVAVALALVGVIADIFMKLSGGGPKFINVKFFIISSIIYMLTIFGWFFVFKYLKVTTIGVFYGVSSLLFLVLVGIFYFNESINGWEIFGVLLGLVSMFILGKFA